MENNIIELDGIFDKGYGFIAKAVMQDNTLSIQAKAIYAYLCSYSGRGKEVFPSRKKICADLNISNDTLGKYLKQLKEKEYINIEQTKDEQNKFSNNIYKINLKIPYTKISDTGKLDTNNNNISNNNNNNIIISQTKEIIEYMNNVCEHRLFTVKKYFRFKYNTNNTKSLISARINEGYNIEDFKDVIFYSYLKFVEREFEGLHGNSSINYFTPTVIFSPSKFERYLNEYRNQITD